MLSEHSLLTAFGEKLQKTIEYTRGEIMNVRSGKVSPSLIEHILVNAYQGQMKLKLMELASIAVNGPLGLLVTPFDVSTVKDVEVALAASPLGITPRVQGKTIQVALPPLSEEVRRKLLKVVAGEIEKGKMQLRAARDEARKKIKTHFEEKDLSEDQKFRLEKEVDKIAHTYAEKLEKIHEKKRVEIMEV
ncbi:MAG TPA: ribosome-recycling factor [Patescibacteria group bacterium]|nr:ribosome-recycling factor [Patescibacteria group bacterium]